jgi:hypothetical protein
MRCTKDATRDLAERGNLDARICTLSRGGHAEDGTALPVLGDGVTALLAQLDKSPCTISSHAGKNGSNRSVSYNLGHGQKQLVCGRHMSDVWASGENDSALTVELEMDARWAEINHARP